MRNYKIDTFKFFAAVGVVLIHASAFMVSDNVASFSTYYWWRPALEICVPFFFATSGYLLSNKKDDYLVRYIMRIITIYIVFTLFYLLIDLAMSVALSVVKNTTVSITDVIDNITLVSVINGTVGSAHLWYLMALIISVFMLWVFLKIDTPLSILLISAIAFFLISLIPSISELAIFRSGGFPLGFSYVSIGYYIGANDIKLNNARFYLTASSVIYMAVSYLTEMGSIASEIFLLFCTYFLMVLCNVENTEENFTSKLGKYSLAIYILHILVVALYDNVAGLIPQLNIESDILRVLIITFFGVLIPIVIYKPFDILFINPIVKALNKSSVV